MEYIFKEAVFLGPKIYAGITTTGKYICKIKGFKNASSIPFEVMKSLLHKDSSVELSHVKWFRNIDSQTIEMKNQLYNLQKTSNKRTFVYNKNVAFDTNPIKLDTLNE